MFPPEEIKQAVYNAIPKTYINNSIEALVVYANQDLSGIEKLPLITLNWLEPTYNNTPIANLMDIKYDSQNDELKITKGVRIKQSLDINIYDNKKRIDDIAGELFLALQKLDLSKYNAAVFNVLPPKNLDILEKGIKRRLIELQVVYRITWQEVQNYIEEIKFSVNI